MPADLPVTPLAPSGVGQEQRHGLAFVGIGENGELTAEARTFGWADRGTRGRDLTFKGADIHGAADDTRMGLR